MSSASIRQSLARLALRRQPIHSSKRFSSSESQHEKAQDTLAAAQKFSGKVFENAKKILEPVGEYTGRLFGSYRQPLLYNLAVTREIIKQVYIRESLQPPSLSTIRTAYSSLWSQISAPGLIRSLFRNGEVPRLGVYGLQAYGIFKIGEILGRRSLVGYDLH